MKIAYIKSLTLFFLVIKIAYTEALI